ncbi:hypothetical protein [Tychonema sp. LEGE 06208]|uniref:hypothetical protein n=1 Tax=Tychonema sp. LEGE 06208 TaxID=1828663 RepID=UPI001D14C708|nr:hypothetical protein [Tychonema sp. LEGE 06208]
MSITIKERIARASYQFRLHSYMMLTVNSQQSTVNSQQSTINSKFTIPMKRGFDISQRPFVWLQTEVCTRDPY